MELVRYEAARSALAAAHKVDEVKDIRDKAVALAEYARQAKDTELIGHATDIRMRAEQRWGELYARQEKAKGTRGTAKGSTNGSGSIVLRPPEKPQPSLSEMGVTKTQSVKWQALAALPDEKFEARVAEARRKAEASTTSAPRHSKSEFTGEVEWYTPSEFLILARKVLGAIDLDPASSSKAQETVQAAKFFTFQQDGLKHPWHGRIWLNPPYMQPHISNFAQKLVGEYRAQRVSAAIMLTHNYTDTVWFQDSAKVASAICFTRGRIRFLGSDGALAAPTQGQAFFYFGNNLKLFSQVFKDVGFIAVMQ